MSTENLAADPCPTDELVLSCARIRVDAARALRIRNLVRAGLDWDDLIRLSRRHGVTPLLYRAVRTVCPEAIPTTAMASLRNYVRDDGKRGLYLTAELLTLVRLFEEHGIRAVPFKGPVLAALAYRNLALRPFADLDIVIRRGDIASAVRLLIARGYQPASRRLALKMGQRASLDEAVGQSVYCALERGAARVDLQWRLVDPCLSFPLDRAPLWDGMRLVPLGGMAVRTFSPEALLLILCAHGSKHAWERLLWVCDVAELVRATPAMHWQRAIDQASAAGGRRMLFLGLLLARELLEAPLPEHVVRDVTSDRVVASLAAQIVPNLLSRASRRLDDRQRSALLVRVRERWRDRARHYPALLVGGIRHTVACRHRVATRPA